MTFQIKEYNTIEELYNSRDTHTIRDVVYNKEENRFYQYLGDRNRLCLDKITTPAEEKLERIRAILEE